MAAGVLFAFEPCEAHRSSRTAPASHAHHQAEQTALLSGGSAVWWILRFQIICTHQVSAA